MNKPKYLKLIAVVEENYKPICGTISIEDGDVVSENVMSFKLNDNFEIMVEDGEREERFDKYMALILAEARLRSKEKNE